jgi:WD40 repeat protein
MVRFSALERSLLGAACDYTVSVYNTEQQKVQHHYTNMHSGPAKQIAFSPLNKMLMCSVSSDHNVCFYDINEKVLVKKIRTETPLSCVSFCQDGHTIALGSDQDDGQVLIYDLRKSSNEVLRQCAGHSSRIQSLAFASKDSATRRELREETRRQEDTRLTMQNLNRLA